MKKPTAYLGLILLFLTGIGVGIAGHSAWMKERLRRFQKHGPSLLHGTNMQRMTEKLDLTERQREQITQIMELNHEAFKMLRDAQRKESSELKGEAIQAIQKTLSDEQEQIFKEMLEKHDQLLKQHREKRQSQPGQEPPQHPGPPEP